MGEKRDLKDTRYISLILERIGDVNCWFSVLYTSLQIHQQCRTYIQYIDIIYNYRTVFPFTSIDTMNE